MNKQAIIKAVERAKKSGFKATAIKVELEASLNRSWDEERCHYYLMEKLEELGLSDGDDPLRPLSYARFYRDGSVDSEFTFTLMLNKPENIFLLPKIIEVFKDMAAKAGDRFETRGAGLHMAWINDKQGSYNPSRSVSDVQMTRFRNFRKSMTMLMPALYFLASSNDKARNMNYRRPGVGFNTHRAAIDYRGGALEFRVFDTCYDNPEAILDNVVVMANCLKYWRKTYRSPGLEKITNYCKFGTDGEDLSRLYATAEHIDLLNRGLRRIKPSYYSVKEIKSQRKFSKTKHQFRGRVKEITAEVKREYEEYLERFEFRIAFVKQNYAQSDLADRLVSIQGNKQPFDRWLEQRQAELENRAIGNYELAV